MVDKLPTETEIDVKSIPDIKSKISNLPVRNVVIALIVIVLVISGVWFLAVRNKGANPEVTQSVNEARMAFNSGDYDKAQAKYKEALSIDKNNDSINAGMIDAITAKGNATGTEKKAFEQATPYIGQIVKDKKIDFQSLISIGYAYETAGDYEKALTYYTAGLKNNPESAVLWFDKGHVLEFLGKAQESKDAYQKAYALDKENPAILIAIGHQLVRDGKIQEAFDTYVKASNLKNITNQQKAEALTEASFVRRSQDSFSHLPEALEISQKAVSLAPSFSPALSVHALNLYFMGKKIEAFDVMKSAINANPRIAKNYYDLATFYRAKKDYQNAINLFKQAISIVDSDNTILPSSTKNLIKAKFIYELAVTYDLSGLQVNPSDLIVQAINMDSNIKAKFLNDVNKEGLFKSHLSDPKLSVYLK